MTKIKTRVQNKYDLKENWDKATSFIPLKGELVAIAPNMAANEPSTVYKNVPHRIKIGDGYHNLSQLSYIGNPTVSTSSIDEGIQLRGFDSVTSISTNTQKQSIDLYLSLRQEDIYSCNNYEAQEYFQHQIFVDIDDLNSYSSTHRICPVTLVIFGDGESTLDGIMASDVNIVLKPSKCILPVWNTNNTVTDSTYTVPEYNITTQADISSGRITYDLKLPEDLDTNGNYLYSRHSVFKIDLKCFFNKYYDAINGKNKVKITILIENDCLLYCKPVSDTNS